MKIYIWEEFVLFAYLQSKRISSCSTDIVSVLTADHNIALLIQDHNHGNHGGCLFVFPFSLPTN